MAWVRNVASHHCVAAVLVFTLSDDCAQHAAWRSRVRVRAVVHGMEMLSRRIHPMLHEHYHRSPALDQPTRRDCNGDAWPSRPVRALSHGMHNIMKCARYLSAYGFQVHMRARQRDTSWVTPLSGLLAIGQGSRVDCNFGVTMARPRG